MTNRKYIKIYKVEPFGVISIVKSRPCSPYGGQYFTICQNRGYIDQLFSDSLEDLEINLTTEIQKYFARTVKTYDSTISLLEKEKCELEKSLETVVNQGLKKYEKK